MKNCIFLGVDGGGTKTDFFLFDEKGEKLGHIRTGTCSHEALLGYEAAEEACRRGVDRVCAEGRISPSDIDYAVLGLSGADTRQQHGMLQEMADHILHCPSKVFNDSVLGILAAAPNGAGVCCINGTATNVCGINENGETLQVGGFGQISSDFGGGEYLAREVLRGIYSARYHDIGKTALTQEVLNFLKADASADLMELFHPEHLKLDKETVLNLDQILFRCARQGDAISVQIISAMTKTLAQSAIGCIKNLNFRNSVMVVLAGSIWVKSDYPEMIKLFRETVQKKVSCRCEVVLLEQPPAMGAVLGAYKYYYHRMPDEQFREKVERGVML